MPIYHKTPSPSATVGNHNTAEIDYHTSEAAKVKRTREQAYFNSYDFDAIEVLPYDDDEEGGEEEEDDDDANAKEKGRGKTHQRESERRQLKSKQNHKQQNKSALKLATAHSHPMQHQNSVPQHQAKPQQQITNHCSSSNSLIVDNRQQHQHQLQLHHLHPLHPVNNKNNPFTYLQRISSIFASNANNKPQAQHQHQHNQRAVKGSVYGVGNKDIPVAVAAAAAAAAAATVAVNALSHDNKHLKLSSSETSSTTLSASSNIEELLNIDKVGIDVDVDGDVIATGSVVASSESVRDVSATGTRPTTTSDKTNLHAPTKTAAATTASNSNGNNGNNFLLPRAILKYQSSTLNAQQGVAAATTTITVGTTNSMPLATTVNTTNNISTTTNTIRQHQLQPKPRDVRSFPPFKGSSHNNNAMMPNSGSNTGLRLKKTSSTSSVLSSLASVDIAEEAKDLEANDDDDDDGGLKQRKEAKVLPKTTVHTKISARASSHQSHYSTDKSASSGYYSSNVCSTYSLEEHIYSEPTLDVKKLRSNAKESDKSPLTIPSAVTSNTATVSAVTTLQHNHKLPVQKQQSASILLLPPSSGTNTMMRSLDKKNATHYRSTENDTQTVPSNRSSQEFSENLKILESSIENLDRHLKSFPGVDSQEALVNYTQNPFNPYASVNHNEKLRPASSYHQLPTIQETYDGTKKQSWNEDPSDDSLMDIDLDSFLLNKDQQKNQKPQQVGRKQGVDNPTFLTEEQEENHYKCAKYINSCPEDAYRVDSDIIAPARSSISGQSVAVSVDLYPKRYEEQLHFQNTRELLEDVRDKIRLLTQTQEAENNPLSTSSLGADPNNQIPTELHLMINTLKQELELYLDRMNQHSELEIRQLCTGLVKNQHIVKMKNAFERRRSLTEIPDIYSAYESVQDGIVLNARGQPITITQQITSIRCSSDPNFKMKRKSLTEVFPLAECYVESAKPPPAPLNKTTTQLQRNLSYHKPVLEQLKPSQANTPAKQNQTTAGSNTASGGDSSEPNDKDSILDWHRKKPSIWEMYYGTNRIQQSLLGGKKNGLMVTTATSSSPSTMCYPSSRPESDFTLDLPRAEQLRIKMEKEKKFRQRCRVITTFLSLVFFLLTVMVVSLVLTRGKRMFGSMI